jgi:hypothetical protein
MPVYGGTGQATLLRSNQQVYLFQQEAVAAGRASIALQLERVNRSFYPWGVSFQVQFFNASGVPTDPGTFEIDIQTSDIDQDSQYCNIQQWGSGTLNTFFVGRIELPNFYAKYVRAFVKTLGGGLITLLATR